MCTSKAQHDEELAEAIEAAIFAAAEAVGPEVMQKALLDWGKDFGTGCPT